MFIQAKLKNALIAPRKARLVADLIRKKPVSEAMSILKFTPNKGARIIKGVLASAVANAVHNYNLDKENLFLAFISVQDGLVLKRWMPRAHGHASQILKRRSHILITLGEVKQTAAKKEGRQTKMKTFSYEEVKKVMEEAKKASKMAEKKGSTQPDKAKIPPKEALGGEKAPPKEIESHTKFSRLGDTFKKLFHRTTKKG